jgi:hypothetical protein
MKTVRERIEAAVSSFDVLDGVLLTTFNLNGAFLEEQALPIVMGVDAESSAAGEANLHQQLAETPCTVFYDPAITPKLSGKYRYVARPVPLHGRFFHPKLVILSGVVKKHPCVYLAVSSANLTLSGWGRNGESFGETWIHHAEQQTCTGLKGFLSWLQEYAAVEEVVRESQDALSRILRKLNQLTDVDDSGSTNSTLPWSEQPPVHLYTSVVEEGGLQNFLQQRHPHRPKSLYAFSPYWSDVKNQLASFDAEDSTLLPSLKVDGAGFGLSQTQVSKVLDEIQVRRNQEDRGTRFLHMKMYYLEYSESSCLAVGSCNFTQAGLSGVAGNVEAMLVFPLKQNALPEGWLPIGDTIPLSELNEEDVKEEEVPRHSPVQFVLAWDWKSRCWRWWLKPVGSQTDFVLQIDGHPPFSISEKDITRAGSPPTPGARYTLRYQTSEGEALWEGVIVELNLNHSERTYGRPLSIDEILESWRGRAPSISVGTGEESEKGAGESEGEQESSQLFDVVNLYDFYRAMDGLSTKLKDLENQPDLQRTYLVGRADSVVSLARLVCAEATTMVTEYLVLKELHDILTERASLLEEEHLLFVQKIYTEVRTSVLKALERELGEPHQSGQKSSERESEQMLLWFEDQLQRQGGVQ